MVWLLYGILGLTALIALNLFFPTAGPLAWLMGLTLSFR